MLRTGSDGRTVPDVANSRTPCKESISVKHADDARTVAAAPAIQIQNTLSPANNVYDVTLRMRIMLIRITESDDCTSSQAETVCG